MNHEQVFKTQGVMAVKGSQKSGMIVGIAVLLGLLLGGGGVAAWAKSVTDPVAPKERTATLHIDKGSVEVDGKPAQEGDKLAEGMVVTTKKNTQAELRFFDASVVRLAPETQITIQKLDHDPKKPTEDKVGIMVDVGRVWSRVMNLLSLNAEFTVQSSTTVATVRGTAFDFAVKKDAKGKMWTHVNGAESIIDCEAKKWKGIIKKGEWLHVPEDTADLKSVVPAKAFTDAKNKKAIAGGVFMGMLDMPELVDLEWSNENLFDDKQFLKAMEDMRALEDEELMRPFMMPIIGGLLETVAETRIANASGDDRDEMMASFAERKLARANQLAEEGKSEEAMQVMKDLKNQFGDLDAEDAEYMQEIFSEAIGRGALAKKFGDQLINQLPEFQEFTNEADAALLKSVLLENRFRDLQEDFDAGEMGEFPMFDMSMFEDEMNSNPILEQRYDYLLDWQKQLQFVPDEFDIPTTDGVNFDAMDVDAIMKQIETLNTTVPIDPIRMPTVPLPMPEPESTFAPVVTSYLIIDGPSSVQAEDEDQLYAYFVYSDGTRKDVTNSGTWTTTGGMVSSNGYFTAPFMAGSATVSFSTVDADGKPRSTSANILVEPHLDMGF